MRTPVDTEVKIASTVHWTARTPHNVLPKTRRIISAIIACSLAVSAYALPAFATQPQHTNGGLLDKAPASSAPLYAQDTSGTAAQTDKPDPASPPDAAAPQNTPIGSSGESSTGDSVSVEIIKDMSALPAPVREMRDKIIAAASTGDIEKLRALTGQGDGRTQILGNEDDDPVETLKGFSGDQEGQEILAILIDLLSTGAAHFQKGQPDEVYVWPYFAGKSLSSLTPPERVDLLRIVTAGDLIGMEDAGSYNFYRIGISPDGHWKFVAGGD